VKTRVFLAMKNRVSLSPKQAWCDPTIYYSKQTKIKRKAKINTLQEKRIVHEAIKIQCLERWPDFCRWRRGASGALRWPSIPLHV
jgi:hypothetical protein